MNCAVAQLQFEMVFERPPRSLRSRLLLVRGRAAEGGRGSPKHHLEMQSAPYEQPLVEPQLRHL